MENNAIVSIAENAEAFLADGITGNEPVFDVKLMKELAKEKIGELELLPQFDLATEAGRKQLNAAVKPVKQLFDDFEKNIKVVKKCFSEIPKKCDATSKAVRDIVEPAIEKIKSPLAQLKEQEAQVQKWWKKEGIPFDKYSLEMLAQTTADAKPLPYSTEDEASDFCQRKGAYLEAVHKALDTIYKAEKAEHEEKERLRQQSDEQARVAEHQAREAAMQSESRRQLEAQRKAVEEESRRVAEAAAELEEKHRAAANPANADLREQENTQGAPPADCAASEWNKEAMEYEARAAIESLMASLLPPYAGEIAEKIIAALKAGEIPHARFYYE
jgi:chromosome segregation ATPase